MMEQIMRDENLENYENLSEYELYFKLRASINRYGSMKEYDLTDELTKEMYVIKKINNAIYKYSGSKENVQSWFDFWQYYVSHNLTLKDVVLIDKKIEAGLDVSEYMPKVSYLDALNYIKEEAISDYNININGKMDLSYPDYENILFTIFNTLNSYKNGFVTKKFNIGYDELGAEIMEYTKDFNNYMELIFRTADMFLIDKKEINDTNIHKYIKACTKEAYKSLKSYKM